ncbi:MAG: HD domain-containing protein [Candidatus Falkowbacteria bacterium]
MTSYFDAFYGQVEITEPVLNKLIASQSVTRLMGIGQFGIPDRYYHIKGFSRHDHSLGVLFCLRQLGASVDEQAAGLLHDVSHTAFSHLIDWVMGNNVKEDYQDNRHHQFFDPGTELAEILSRHGLQPEKIAQHENYTLLECPAPDVCADRFDYAIREFSVETAKGAIKNITNINGQMVFRDQTGALSFAEAYLELQQKHWGGREAVTRYHIFAHLMRIAIKTGVITLADFDQDDEVVMKKIESSDNKIISEWLEILSHKQLPLFDNRPNVIANRKFRYVDPLFLKGDKIERLSEHGVNFKNKLAQARIDNEKGIAVPKL